MLKNHINSTFVPDIKEPLWLYHIIKQMQKLWYEESAILKKKIARELWENLIRPIL